MFCYAARNALLPNVTAFGMALGFVLSGALVTEIVFAYPGLGYLLLKAVRNLDYPLMQGIFLMITLAVLAPTCIVDLLYVRLDPRVRGSSAQARGRRPMIRSIRQAQSAAAEGSDARSTPIPGRFPSSPSAGSAAMKDAHPVLRNRKATAGAICSSSC